METGAVRYHEKPTNPSWYSSQLSFYLGVLPIQPNFFSPVPCAPLVSVVMYVFERAKDISAIRTPWGKW